MPSIREVKESLDFLKSGITEIVKMSSANQALPVPKVSFDFVDDKSKTVKGKRNIVSKEIYSKILRIIDGIFSENESFMSLTEIAKKVYNKGIRPQVTPEEFVEVILQAVNETESLESSSDMEGIKYRRNTNAKD